MFDRIIGWSLRNRGAVVLLYLVLAAAAVTASTNMAIDVFPEFAPPQVQIQTEAPGFSTKDVEALVTRPLEIVLQGAPDIDQIRSNSSAGLSRVTVVFRWGIDIYRARQIIQERLQLVQGQLPETAGTVQLMPVTSAVSWLLKFALIDWAGTARENELRAIVDWDFRNRLLAQRGVASVVAVGGGVKQYQAMVDPLRLRKFGISFDEVVRSQRLSNNMAPGAFIYPTLEEEYFVRANGMVSALADLGGTLVAMRDGQPVKLEDVADVKFGSEIKRGDGQIYGGPAIIGTISKLWGADTLETTRAVEVVLRQLTEHLPKDVELIPNVFRQATFIESSLGNLKQALLHSSVIVALVLLLFLARWRPTVISLIAIPTSLLSGILVLWGLGIGINALTLGGLVFAIGEVVDDAIIDVENIMRRLRENKAMPNPLPTIDIIYDGSREIRNSVVFATLVIVLAFIPIFFLQGIEGRIFRPLAVAYLAATGSSLIVAISLVPVLCYYMMGRSGLRQSYGVSRITGMLGRIYGKALARMLRQPRALIAATLILLLAAVLLIPGLGRSFIPAFNEGNIVVATTLMPGTSLEENLRVGREVDAMLGGIPEIALLAQRAGRSRLDEDAQPVNFSEFDITLKPGTRNVSEVMQLIRNRLATIPGLAANVSQFITHRMSEILSGVRSQVAVKIYGGDYSVLQQIQQEVYAAVKDIPGVVDLQVEPMITVPGVDIRMDRAVAARYGFTPGQVVMQIGQAFNGTAVSKALEQDRTFDIFIRVDDTARSNVKALGEFPLMSPAGATVPLRELAKLVAVQEPYMINRDGGSRRAVVQWNTQGRDLNNVVIDAQSKIRERVHLPAGYSIEFSGDYEGQQRASRDLLLSSGAAVLLMFVIMFQAFRRWPLVVLVMMNLPLALIGAILALAIMGETLNVSSMIGLIVLFGIATRNSILLITRFQNLMDDDPALGPEQVAIQGALDRLAPILMTACTAALAAIPLMLGDPAGKELERPLAVVLLGGMLSSTLLNLFLLPILFARLMRHGMFDGTRIPDLSRRGGGA